MELSPRLRAVAGWVPPGARPADIGTDHGLLPVWLLQKGVAERVIAADLRAGPLEAARRTAARYGMEDRISFRLCDGLTGISPGEIDTAVIAGMGGETILGILSAAPWILAQETLLLLQPQSAFPELRGWLGESGYRISREKIVREGDRLYTVMEVRAGPQEPLTPGELWAGKQSDDPLRGVYLDWLDGVLSRALEGKRRSAGGDPAEADAVQEALEDIRRMRKEWESWQ